MLVRSRFAAKAEAFNLFNYQNITGTDASGKTINTLTANGTAFGTVSNSNNSVPAD